MTHRTLESALAHVLQAQRIVIEQERAERTVRNVLRPSHSVIKHAEEATLTAKTTLTAASTEFCDLIRDLTSSPDSAPKSRAVASPPDEVRTSAVASNDAPMRDATPAQHPSHPVPMGATS